MSQLEQIYHFEQITPRIGCSGQPTAEQFSLIADAGYSAVINLALPDSDNAVADEGSRVSSFGMSYHHLPVKFDDPTLADLQRFFGIMQALAPAKVWVHCVVNARVSAFLYHYLRYVENAAEQTARTHLLDRWEPQMDEVWQAFLRITREQALG